MPCSKWISPTSFACKLIQHVARANAYGQILLGLDRPAADVSRGSNAHDILGVAAIIGLQQFPIVNASIEGENIHYHRHVNVGIAVALDWGLIVPVLKNADELNFLGLQRGITDLGERARNKKLKPEEVEGSTFTVTNPGQFGAVFGLPIINQPNSAIMGVGGIAKTPVVVTDADGNDSIAIRSLVHLTLGYGHRIIDGAVADQFMALVKKTLENWSEEVG